MRQTLFLFLFLPFISIAQVQQWVNQIGSTENDIGIKSAVDINGNIYTVGNFRGAGVDFDPSINSFLLNSAGESDGFVVKYDKYRNFKWAFRIGGTDKDDIKDIVLDHSGNLIITGFFRGQNVDFDPGIGTAFLSSNGETGTDPGFGGDIFIAKYDTLGQYIWAFNIGGSSVNECGIAVAVDNNDNVLATGYFRGSGAVDFDPSPSIANLNSELNGPIYVAKYNSAGQYQWAFSMGMPSADNSGWDIKSDNLNNVIVTGYFQGTNIDFDPSTSVHNLSSNGALDIFLAKYNSAGQWIWSFNVGGSNSDAGRSIVVDSNNNIYITGEIRSLAVDFSPGPGENFLQTAGGADIFVAKYSSIGENQWAFRMGSSSTVYDDIGWHICLDYQNHLLVTGTFSSASVDFDPSGFAQGVNYTGKEDVFAAKYTTDADFLCAFGIGGPEKDAAYCISTFGDYCYITGEFSGACDFDPSPLVSPINSVGGSDIFVSKYFWANQVPTGTIVGSTICAGEQPQFTYYSSNGSPGPFILLIQSPAGTTFEVDTIHNGVPFTVWQWIYFTTTYHLIMIKDFSACDPTVLISMPVTVNVVSCANSIINNYTPVLDYSSCYNRITVEDASAFNVGDSVLLIQMKGAVIDSTNTSNFGNIINYNSAGNYEFNAIKNKIGNKLDLTDSLTRSYDIPNGKVQLIRVPSYQNVTVSSTLTCPPWDGSKGGVLVLRASDSIIFNADIDVSGKGFRGGNAVTNPIYNCNVDSFYLGNNDGSNGAYKGEGIYFTNNLLSGRGKIANGGGGGNATNSGGAGGSNGGNGGSGGKQYVGAVCNTNFSNGGIGGMQLNYNNAANKIFLGGGAGAGHENDVPALAPGGNGGGIAIIIGGVLKTNNKSILATGTTPAHLTGTNDDGRSGGGAGGTVLLNYTTLTDNLNISVAGGNGDYCADLIARHGPGGGGGGGIVWVNKSTVQPAINLSLAGGMNGVNTNLLNDPWGATPGNPGDSLKNLLIPIDTIHFKPNFDSVRIKDSAISCRSFDFKGLAYTNIFPIVSWQWYFGDGGTANSQNTNHSYAFTGNYTVKLVVTNINGCKDSTTKVVTAMNPPSFDFNYQVDVCTPLTVQFNGVGIDTLNSSWLFGDGNTAANTIIPSHTYSSQGNYTVKYSVSNGNCRDTISKTINLSIQLADIILTHDTTICYGATKQLLTSPALSFCWTPSTFLNDPNLPNPITSTTQNITYYFTAQVQGTNAITNGDFSQGNTGFTSQYVYANPNVTEGQYFVGNNPQAWNIAMSPCHDHTTGTGNMMMVNGAPTPNVNVWTQTVSVTPNTNYAFSTWIQALYPPNPAQLKFSINGNLIGSTIVASLPPCTWSQFYTTWNSGNNTSATISIVNVNTAVQGNDFALDDISFAPVTIKRDSVVITVEQPVVSTNNDTTFCPGSQIQLNSTGANNYSWSPAANLSNPNIANPVATPSASTQYVVTGTTINGCNAKDTVVLTFMPKPTITISNDTSICQNSSVQLIASGGNSYNWSPVAGLNNANIFDPVATPTTSTIYYVTVIGSNTCTNSDSVKIDVRPIPAFTISPSTNDCIGDSVQLIASGGNIYNWQPALSLTNSTINNPRAFPVTTTTYTVQITESVCNISTTLSTTVVVLPLPLIKASKSGDLDCTSDFSQLNATGGMQYVWSPVTTLNNPNIANPAARPTAKTTYKVRGTDANGCVNYDTVTVDITSFNKGDYLMPSAFTPNGDGLNDCYGIKYWGVINELEFSIYNRWGEKVFYTKNPTGCWDGTFRGHKQDSNVFVYLIKAKTSCGEVFRKGTFVLIR